tara:strand:+ start:128 stop:451 length:324 start_codon:yes stop_codon:yes gene_type:complete
MAKRRSKRNIKKRTRMKKVSIKPIGFIYYKMERCKYCKQFESELWKKIVDYCNKKGIKTHIVVRELNPELIPNKIKLFPSFAKYDKNDKITIFKDERTLNNLRKFLN